MIRIALLRDDRGVMGGILRLLLALTLVAGCGTATTSTPTARATPTPTSAGMDAVQAALALRGATIHQVVSGDAGCPSVEGLHSNAARLEVSLAEAPEERYDIYLFRWRRPADFAAAEQPFSDCVDAYGAGVDGEVPIDGLEIEPWRAYGPAWSEELMLLLEDALRDVSGG
jgi:hypothetical protein